MWLKKVRKDGVALGAWAWAEPPEVAVVEAGRIGGGVGFDIEGRWI